MPKVNIQEITEDMRKVNKPVYYKLRNWYESIKDYEQLSLKETKNLNKLMLETTGEIHDKYRERLILGTLHYVYNFVCKSGLTAIKSTYFDVDDLISISIEVWINMLDKGILLNDNIKSFKHLFLEVFYIKVTNQVLSEETKKYYATETGYNQIFRYAFGIILDKYLETFNECLIIDDISLYKYIINVIEENDLLKGMYSRKITKNEKNSIIYQIYLIFYNIIKVLDLKDINHLSKTYFNCLKYLLYDTALSERSAGTIAKCDFTEEVNNEIIIEDLRNVIFNIAGLTERQKNVLLKKFGFSDEIIRGNREISEEFNVSVQRVDQITNKAILKLSRNQDVRSLGRAILYK